ncbi:MAG TPA: DUF5985 family protein [Nevskiaceae bacterium]|nr:DUF5985 family protein [Nevskiaceae bacterium]
MITGFLIGIIFALYMIGALFFLKFWMRTRDRLFVAFAAAFVIEGLNRLRFLVVPDPEEGSFGIYAVRIIAFSLIAAAIIAKNMQQKN